MGLGEGGGGGGGEGEPQAWVGLNNDRCILQKTYIFSKHRLMT